MNRRWRSPPYPASKGHDILRAITGHPAERGASAFLAEVKRDAEPRAKADAVADAPEQHGGEWVIDDELPLDPPARVVAEGVQHEKRSDDFRDRPRCGEGQAEDDAHHRRAAEEPGDASQIT